jgi:hypothetical protein
MCLILLVDITSLATSQNKGGGWGGGKTPQFSPIQKIFHQKVCPNLLDFQKTFPNRYFS